MRGVVYVLTNPAIRVLEMAEAIERAEAVPVSGKHGANP